MAKDPPLIDIDGTFFVQLVLFIAIAYILSRFLFKPFLQVRRQRDESIEGARAEAGRMEEEASARLSSYEQQIGRARREAQEQRQKLHAEAVTRERQIHEVAIKTTQETVAQSRARLESDAAAARKELEPKSREIAKVITDKVLS
jgi:F-type H+-transporting ATPase subunit b